MTEPKKRSTPSRGGWPRPQADSPRERFLWAEVTKAEHDEIQAYCRGNHISVSQFMADLLLKDASKSKAKRKQKVTLRPEIQLTRQQQAKLELLARLHQKKSVGEYILDVLEPELELQRLHAPRKTKMVRYYLSDDEHATVTNHIAESGLSATNYAAMLALRIIRKDTKRSR
jgi:hypothetical protein